MESDDDEGAKESANWVFNPQKNSYAWTKFPPDQDSQVPKFLDCQESIVKHSTTIQPCCVPLPANSIYQTFNIRKVIRKSKNVKKPTQKLRHKKDACKIACQCMEKAFKNSEISLKEQSLFKQVLQYLSKSQIELPISDLNRTKDRIKKKMLTLLLILSYVEHNAQLWLKDLVNIYVSIAQQSIESLKEVKLSLEDQQRVAYLKKSMSAAQKFLISPDQAVLILYTKTLHRVDRLQDAKYTLAQFRKNLGLKYNQEVYEAGLPPKKSPTRKSLTRRLHTRSTQTQE